jgi:hypothetical protein
VGLISMNILYCDACGIRVSEDDLSNGRGGRKAHLTYCESCAPAHVPKKQPGSGIHAIPKKRPSGIHARATTTLSAPSTLATSRRESRGGGGSAGVIIGAVGTVFILLSLVILNAAGGNKNTVSDAGIPAATTKTNDTLKPTDIKPATVPPKIETNVTPAKSKRPDTGVDEIRENFARRQWLELKFEADRSPTGWTTGRRIKDFAVANANTQAGKDAAEYLTKMKNPVPPPPGTNVYADYLRDFKAPDPGPGWRYLWNKDGVIGDPKKYAPLQWNASQGGYAGDSKKYPADEPLGCAQLQNAFGHPGAGVDNAVTSFDRFVIAAYTLQQGQSGKTAMDLGLTYTRKDVTGGRIELRVYVNETLLGSMLISSSPTENQIATQLGDLKPGDTVYFCVGPDREGGNDSFAFHFTIYPVP